MFQAKSPSSIVPSTKGSDDNADGMVNEELESWSCTDAGDPLTKDPYTEVGLDNGYLYDVLSQHDLPTQSEECTGVPLLHFGAQFGTGPPDPAAYADELTADASTPSVITSKPSGDATYVEGHRVDFTEFSSSINARKHWNYTSDENHQPLGPILGGLNDANSRYATRPSAGLQVYEHHRPSIVVVDEEGRPVLPAAGTFHPWPSDNLETPTHVVHNAQALTYAFHAQWLPRLAAAPEAHARCAMYTPDSLFRIGLWTLQDCYRGGLPSTFEKLFALMLVAFAFYNEKYQDSGLCDSADFSRDIYRWHSALYDFSERNLFVIAWHRLWCSRECKIGVTEGSGLSKTSAYSPSSTSTIFEAPAEHAHCMLPQNYPAAAYGIPAQQDRNSLVKTLMGGMVMAGCSRFLDAVQYTSINKRNAQGLYRLPWDDTNNLFEDVIQPLERCHATVQYPAYIASIMGKLRNGLIRNVRELEVTLISGSELSRLPLQVQRTYSDHITVQCNIAKYQYSSDWRNGHYVAALNDVISLSEDPVQRHETVSSTLQNELVSGMYNGQFGYISGPDVDHDGLYAHSNCQHFTAARPALPPVAFGASVDNNHPGSRTPDAWHPTLQNTSLTHSAPRSLVSSDFLSDGSPSSSQSVSEPSSHTTLTVTTCERCPDKIFEGAPQNQRRNLRRHMFSEHGLHPKLECPVPGCPITFKAGRKDNLKRHVRQNHPLTE